MGKRQEDVLRKKLGQFVQQYGRKKRPGRGEPNDRKYSRQFAKRVKRMKPEQLNDLLNE
jgi:hypothetical protein